jgi:hypothetical protein
MKKFVLIYVGIMVIAATLLMMAQSDKTQRPSPPATAEVTLKGQKITIAYSRPSMKGRKVMGELVPYGKVWRTGANEATALSTTADITMGGTKLPKGNYTIYSLPDQKAWQLIINKQTGQWGTVYDEKQDFARIPLKKESLSGPVEQFTMAFEKKSEDSALLTLSWENTKLSVPVSVQ